MRKLLSILFLLLIVGTVQAAGFRVALQSAKQLGMGHVGAGLNLGPESIFFNPGALALSERGGVSVTGNAVFSNVDFNTPGSTYRADLESNIGVPFAAYGSFNISDRFSGGVGVYTPHGNEVEWPEDWAGRFLSQSIDLKAIFVQPTLSYQITEKLGIGAGFIYAFGDVELQRGIPVSTNGAEPNALLETDGYANGTGFNAGIFYEPTDEFSFGVNYRSKVEVDAEQGFVTTENLPPSLVASGNFDATRFDATLPLPAELAIGLGFKPSDRLTIGADLNYSFWSQYESLDFSFNGNLGNADNDVTMNDQASISQNWSDSWTVKIGGEFSASEKFDLRLGGYYDFSPVPDETLSPITPDTDRLAGTGGISYMPSNKFSIDGAVLYINGRERTVLASENQAGFGQRYKSTAIIPSLGFNFSFNK